MHTNTLQTAAQRETMASSDEQDTSDTHKRRKYHRHSPHQIQELEAAFQACPHPDEKQRMQLSKDLRLEPQQIKFWFQNRRTQMKTQQERAGNDALRSENDMLRSENIMIALGLKYAACPNCRISDDDACFDKQTLMIENARLKDELDRVLSITQKYLGKHTINLLPIQPSTVSSLDLPFGGFYGPGDFENPGLAHFLNLDLLPMPSPSPVMPFPLSIAITENDKIMMEETARNAMGELIKLVQTDEPLWMKTEIAGMEVLNLETYNMIFQRPAHDLRTEATRDSGLIGMNAMTLVDMFMDSSKWMELFPTIVSRAMSYEILTSGIAGSSGSLVLMYEELQALSPVVPTRLFYFLRYCQRMEPGLWVIADVSVDLPGENMLSLSSQSRRLPSGCLIQDMPNGYSKVSWVEHMQVDDTNPVDQLYRGLVYSGRAFGAQRWISSLQRMCERLACQMMVATSSGELGEAPNGNRSLMMLSQRMVNNFCASLSVSNGYRWTARAGLNDLDVQITVNRSTDLRQPNYIVLSAATSLSLPIPSQRIFDFLRDEKSRSQWDFLQNKNPIQEVICITNGTVQGNCISLLHGINSCQNNMLIVQESCTDAWGSLVVFSPVDNPSIDIVLSGNDLSDIPLLSSGFIIVPDVHTGSLLTVVFQVLINNLPSPQLNLELVSAVNDVIGRTVHQIKAALNCSSV